jgi:hypothetical protein
MERVRKEVRNRENERMCAISFGTQHKKGGQHSNLASTPDELA